MDNGTTKAVYNAMHRQSFELPSVFDILKHDILTHTNLSDEKINNIALEILKYKEKNFLFNRKKDQFEQIAAVISAYVKGDRYNGKEWEPIFNDFNNFCETNNYIFSDSQWNALFGLIHQVIMSSLTEVQMFSYIEQTFPLWSGLKRILLQQRRGTDLKQWEYAIQKCNLTERKGLNIGVDLVALQEELKDIQSYKHINDSIAELLIIAIGQKEFPDWRIDNIISQPKRDKNGNIIKGKGWFPYGITKNPMQHEVEKGMLYKLGYSFNLSLEDFDRLTVRCEKAIYDAFSIEDNLYRFGMKYSIKYSKITNIIAKAKTDSHRFNCPPSEYNQAEMKQKISNFFNNNIYSDDLIERYLDFLDRNGVCRNSTKLLINLRADNAHRYIHELYKKFNLNNIKDYYAKYDVSRPNVSNIPDISELLKEKYGDDAENYYCYFIDYIRNISETTNYTDSIKNKTLMLICDGINVDTKDIASGAFVKARLNQIKEHSDQLISHPIRRSEIMRLAYLDTLLAYFNYDIADDNIISRFENTANRMLLECEFLPLHITLKLDFIMYLALSEREKCKTNVFQFFIPRNS